MGGVIPTTGAHHLTRLMDGSVNDVGVNFNESRHERFRIIISVVFVTSITAIVGVIIFTQNKAPILPEICSSSGSIGAVQ